jgi:hypothetical protein
MNFSMISTRADKEVCHNIKLATQYDKLFALSIKETTFGDLCCKFGLFHALFNNSGG